MDGARSDGYLLSLPGDTQTQLHGKITAKITPKVKPQNEPKLSIIFPGLSVVRH